MYPIVDLNYAYDLDGGGYSFEHPNAVLTPLLPKHAVVWDEPDMDYVNPDAYRGWSSLFCTLLVFVPGGAIDEFPDYLPDDEDRLVKVATFYTSGVSPHECNCHEFSDEPWPDCRRCHGDGYVDSVGGAWALYALDDGSN